MQIGAFNLVCSRSLRLVFRLINYCQQDPSLFRPEFVGIEDTAGECFLL